LSAWPIRPCRAQWRQACGAAPSPHRPNAEPAPTNPSPCGPPFPPPQGAAPSGLIPVALGPDELEEVRFQAARLAHLWGRAAAAGVEAPLSGERAEYWAWRLERGRHSLREFTDLRHGFQELRLRGVEQRLWDLRRGAAGGGGCGAAPPDGAGDGGEGGGGGGGTAAGPGAPAAPAVIRTV
jgi:hypothetical protein